MDTPLARHAFALVEDPFVRRLLGTLELPLDPNARTTEDTAKIFVDDLTRRFQRFLVRSYLFPLRESKQHLVAFQEGYLDLEIGHAFLCVQLERFQTMFIDDRIWLKDHMKKLISAYNELAQRVNALLMEAWRTKSNPFEDPILGTLLNSASHACPYRLSVPLFRLEEILGLKMIPFQIFYRQNEVQEIEPSVLQFIERLVRPQNVLASIPGRSCDEAALCIELARDLLHVVEQERKQQKQKEKQKLPQQLVSKPKPKPSRRVFLEGVNQRVKDYYQSRFRSYMSRKDQDGSHHQKEPQSKDVKDVKCYLSRK